MVQSNCDEDKVARREVVIAIWAEGPSANFLYRQNNENRSRMDHPRKCDGDDNQKKKIDMGKNGPQCVGEDVGLERPWSVECLFGVGKELRGRCGILSTRCGPCFEITRGFCFLLPGLKL